jgi:hypothetical protein
VWAQGLDPYELREVVVALDIFKTEMSVARAPPLSRRSSQRPVTQPTVPCMCVRSELDTEADVPLLLSA